MSNLKKEEEKKMNIAQYIYVGVNLGHPYKQSTTVLCDILAIMWSNNPYSYLYTGDFFKWSKRCVGSFQLCMERK